MSSSVWRYQVRKDGLMVRGETGRSIVLPLGKRRNLLRKKNAQLPDALYLVALLEGHPDRPGRFAIPQKATAKELGWGSNRLAKAIGSLIAAGWLRKLPNADSAFRQPSRYEWGEFLL